MQVIESINKNLLDLENLVLQLNKKELTTKNKACSNSSIGMHVRHIIEFYTCLKEQYTSGIIDYDARERNLDLEQSKDAICSEIASIYNWLIGIDADQKLLLKANYGEQEADSESYQSGLFRELTYCLEHAIHHFAIIRLVCKINDFELTMDKNFGIAYSTVRYQEGKQINQ